MTDWIAACAAFATRAGIGAEHLAVLDAFGGPTAGSAVDFAELDVEAERGGPALAEQIVAVLDGEVDRTQAQMFARRFRAVLEILGRQARESATARLYRAGLVQRMQEVLVGPTPRALRVRALADYYYSHAAVLHHRRRLGDVRVPSPAELARAARWELLAPGIEHARVDGDTTGGPLHVNLLRIAPGTPLHTLDAREQGHLAALVAQRGAVAGVSGGFFLYSEPDIQHPSRRTDPVGLLVTDGEVVSPPTFGRSALVQHHDGTIAIEQLGMAGVTLVAGEHRVTVRSSNDPSRLPSAFSRAFGDRSPDHSGTSVSIVGRAVVRVGRGSLPIPLAGFVLALPDAVPFPVTEVTYQLPLALRAAMAGGPRLDGVIDLRAEDFVASAPPVTFSRDETFDQNLLPRLAAGLTPEGELIFAAIDGRNFERAPGMTLGGTARLLAALGATRTMNLDGGSSKRMVVRGRVVDLASTEIVGGGGAHEGVRPVHTAILIGGR